MNTPTLDIGCGNSKLPGAIGLDMELTFLAPGDVQFEIHNLPYLNTIFHGSDNVEHKIRMKQHFPFRDNVFGQIIMNDIIEHIVDIPWALSEVHRIAQRDAGVFLRYPHYSSRSASSDVTHVNLLGAHSFDHFDPSTFMGEKYQYYRKFGREFPFKITSVKADLAPRAHPLQFILYSVFGMNLYEQCICKIVPFGNINLEMRVIK